MTKKLGATRRLGLIALVWTLSCHCALALEGGAVDSNSSPTFAGVGSLSLASGGTFSGVLIGSRHVLTAQHVVGSGSDPSQWTFNVNLDALPAADRAFSVANVYAAAGFTGFGSGAVPRNDLTILELTRDVPGIVPVFELSTAPLALGKEITLVGYGGTGAETKRRGTNVVDYLDAPSAGATPDVFAYDYDTGVQGEATVVGGDSGSGMFVNDNGVWKLAGINTFAWENPSRPGIGAIRGGGGMIVSAYAPWIQSVTTVPEPAAWALLCPGMVLVFWLVHRAAPRRGGA
jgi:V8-like Glu-specific endopeptidase